MYSIYNLSKLSQSMNEKSNGKTEALLFVFGGILFILAALYMAFISEVNNLFVLALNGIAGVFLISFGLFSIFKK